MKRFEAIKLIMDKVTNEIVVNCNGMISREAFTAKDRKENFYMIGSMGLASSIGLGIAYSKPDKRVVVLDGDGNILMNMATLATAVSLNAKNYYHVCLDNEVYGSTGDQDTISNVVKLDKIAQASGYKHVYFCDTLYELEKMIPDFFNKEGPNFLLIKVTKGNMEDIARVSHTPEEMNKNFSEAIQA